MAKLTIRNLSKYFEHVKCLDSVNLEVSDGQLAVIVGPSGCGKTTLMRCITGLEKFQEGSIFIDNELINNKQPKERDVAMVFQYYALYPHMTVRQNLSLGLQHTTNFSKEQIQNRVEEIANILKISTLLERKPGQLSGGESQRVAIGRALVREPKIFLLDEPLSAIDAKLRRELRTEIKKIQRRFGITTIYVTHDQEEAMAVGDILVVLCDGRVRQVGTPEEIFSNPKDKFVANFIGKPPMNFIELTVNKKNKGFYLENKDFSYEISRSYFKKYLADHLNKTIILGIRPSMVDIFFKKTNSPSLNTKTATVSLIENMGNENYIYLNADSVKLIVKSDAETTIKVGEKVYFSFDEEDIHLFDKDSKTSLKL